jgi:hypothetical protein
LLTDEADEVVKKFESPRKIKDEREDEENVAAKRHCWSGR